MMGTRREMISRRTYHDECRWWDKTTFHGQVPSDRIVYQIQPSGTFFAKAVSSFAFNPNEIGDIRLSGQSVTIETPDDISRVRVDCLVDFKGCLYRVTSISKKPLTKTHQFMNNPYFRYIVQLVR